MAKDEVQEAHEELVSEYEQFRKEYGKVLEAVQRVSDAEPVDDIYGLLERLEDVVKEVRTGGMLKGGAKGHRKAREAYLQLTTSTGGAT